MSRLRLMLGLGLGWAVMMLMDGFMAWFAVPDLVLLWWLAIFFQPQVLPLWRKVLPFSLLLDVSAAVPLGFYAMYYSLLALMLLPAQRWARWRTLGQVWLLAGLAMCVAVLLRALLLYMVLGLATPTGWGVGVALQIVCWPLVVMWVRMGETRKNARSNADV